MGRKITACETCRSIKALCTKGNPCARCQRLSLPCHYTTKKTGSQSNAAVEASTPRRNSPLRPGQGEDTRTCRTLIQQRARTKNKHTKSANGCVSCRRRRKKCDEKHPVCSDCERLHLTCIQPSQYTDDAEVRKNNTSLLDEADCRQSGTVGASVTENFLKSDAFRAWVASGDHSLASRLSTFSEWLTLIETDNRVDTIRTASLGNLTAAMMDLGQVDDETDDVVLATLLPSTALNNSTGITAASLDKWNMGERHLLNHFLQSVSRAMVVVEDTANPVLHFIAPMALENKSVRHALVALSACHLSEVYPVFEHDLCVARSQALQALMAELDSRENSSVWALASTLLLCLVEICAGNSRKWLLHLHGAKVLLAQLESQESVLEPPVSVLVELYNYISCIASVTSKRVPEVFGHQLQLTPVQDSSGLVLIHPLFGISTSLYQSLSRINQLAARNNQIPQDPLFNLEAEAEKIEIELQSWQPPPDCEVTGQQSRTLTEARAMAFSVQWAAIMRLHQVARGQAEKNGPQIKKASDNILSALSLIRPGSEMEAHLLFPLFMAGVGSMTKASRLTVEYRLNVMEATIGFGNIFTAHRLLDELWRRTNEGERPDWEDLVKNKYQGLVLF